MTMSVLIDSLFKLNVIIGFKNTILLFVFYMSHLCIFFKPSILSHLNNIDGISFYLISSSAYFIYIFCIFSGYSRNYNIYMFL